MIKKNELRCNSCGSFIPWDESYVKGCLVYKESDWHQCLCIRCTNKWKRIKELAEAHPDFGKQVGYKMVCIDELKEI